MEKFIRTKFNYSLALAIISNRIEGKVINKSGNEVILSETSKGFVGLITQDDSKDFEILTYNMNGEFLYSGGFGGDDSEDLILEVPETYSFKSGDHLINRNLNEMCIFSRYIFVENDLLIQDLVTGRCHKSSGFELMTSEEVMQFQDFLLDHDLVYDPYRGTIYDISNNPNNPNSLIKIDFNVELARLINNGCIDGLILTDSKVNVRIIGWDRKARRNIVGLVSQHGYTYEAVISFDENGFISDKVGCVVFLYVPQSVLKFIKFIKGYKLGN